MIYNSKNFSITSKEWFISVCAQGRIQGGRVLGLRNLLRPFFFFFWVFTWFRTVNWTSKDVMTFFFGLHLILGGKLDVKNCGPSFSNFWARHCLMCFCFSHNYTKVFLPKRNALLSFFYRYYVYFKYLQNYDVTKRLQQSVH